MSEPIKGLPDPELEELLEAEEKRETEKRMDVIAALAETRDFLGTILPSGPDTDRALEAIMEARNFACSALSKATYPSLFDED